MSSLSYLTYIAFQHFAQKSHHHHLYVYEENRLMVLRLMATSVQSFSFLLNKISQCVAHQQHRLFFPISPCVDWTGIAGRYSPDVAVVVVEFSPAASASLFARGQRGKKNLTINLARSAIIRATRLSSA